MPLLTTQQGPDPISPNARKRRLEELRESGAWDAPEVEPSGAPNATMGPSGPTDPPQEDASFFDKTRGVLGNTAKAILRGGAEAINETSDFVSLLWGDGDFNVINQEALDEKLPEQEGAYGFIENFAQFGLGMMAVGKFTKPLNWGRKAYRGLRGADVGRKTARTVATGVGAATEGMVAGAVVDFAMVDPWEFHTEQAINNAPNSLKQPVQEYLDRAESDETGGQDAFLWQRTKNAVEGALWGAALGPTIAALSYGVRRTGILKAVRSGKMTEDEGHKALAEALEMQKADVARLTEEEALGIYHGVDGEDTMVLLDPPGARKIVGAAFKHPRTGETIPTGGAHDLEAIEDPVLRKLIEDSTPENPDLEGFVDNRGNYLTRAEAKELTGQKHGESSFVVGRTIGSAAGSDLPWVASPDHFVQRARARGHDRPDTIEHEEYMQDAPGRTVDHSMESQGYDPEVHTAMWHSTISKSGVLADKLRGFAPREGVGGGMPGEVSTTWNKDHADNITDILKMRAIVANGPEESHVGDIITRFDTIYQRSTGAGVLDEGSPLLSNQSFVDDMVEGLARARGIGPADEDALKSLETEILSGNRDSIVEALTESTSGSGSWDEWDLIELLDGSLPATHRSGSVGREIDEWIGIDPDDIATLQVVARPDADPRILPTENEFAFREDEITTVPHLAVQSERQLAARNKLLYRRMTKGFSSVNTAQVNRTIAEITRRLNEGVPVDSPKLVKDIGMNLGLITKTFDDFKQAHMAFLTTHGEDFQKATNRAREGRGQSHAETERQALEIITEKIFGPGKTLDDARLWFAEEFGTDTNQLAAQLHAAHKVSLIIGQDIAQVARAHDLATGAEKAVLNTLLMDMVDSFAEIQIRLGGIEADVGRTLNISRLKGQTPASARASRVADEVGKGNEEVQKAMDSGRALGERGLRQGLDDATKKRIATDLRLSNGDPELIRKGLIHTADSVKKNTDYATKMDRLLSFRTNMLLSGPKTHFVNSFNNMLTTFEVPFEYWWGGVRSGDRELQHYGKDLIPAWGDVKDAFNMLKETWKRGYNILDPTHEIAEGMTDPGWLANMGTGAKLVTNSPGRALMAADEFFKQLNYRASVRANALRMARRDAAEMGLKGSEADAYISEQVYKAFDTAFATVDDVRANRAHNVGQGMREKSLEHARYTSFTNDLEYGIGQTLRQAAARHSVVRLIMPFIRTPVNLVRFAWQRTPLLNRWQRQMQEDLAAGGERAAFAKGRNDVGMFIYGTGIMAALNGSITGGGPSDPKLAAQWRENFQPYSVKVGDQWVSYRRVEPLASAVGLIADFGESVAEQTEEDAMKGAYALIGAMSNAMVSKTFLQGLTDFFDAVSAGDPYTTERVINEMALSFTPNAMRQLNNAFDPTLREARHIIDELQQRTPGWSKSLPPKLNIFGEPVIRPGGAFGRAFSPFTFMQPPEDAHLRRELLMLGEALPMPNPKRFAGNLDLEDPSLAEEGHPPPYTRMLEMMADPPWGDPPLKDVIFNLIQSPSWETLSSGTGEFPGGSKHEVVSTIVSAYTEAAYYAMMDEQPYAKVKDKYVQLTTAQGESLMTSEQKMFDRLK